MMTLHNEKNLYYDLQNFCNIVQSRSDENKKAIKLLVDNELYSNAISILRFELDSMLRVLFLLSSSRIIRENLLNQFFNDLKWRVDREYITDRLMVNKASNIHGWASKVYDFACAFIHLSRYHDYSSEDPFLRMNKNDINIIKSYMIEFHDFNKEQPITFETLKPYIIDIFDKINNNLELYIEDLRTNPGLKTII